MKSKKLIVLGVTGSIAAFKAADLCSKLAKEFEVQVMMTENACRFVTPVTFRTLSRRPVITTLWADESEWRPRHVELSDEASLFDELYAKHDIEDYAKKQLSDGQAKALNSIEMLLHNHSLDIFL